MSAKNSCAGISTGTWISFVCNGAILCYTYFVLFVKCEIETIDAI